MARYIDTKTGRFVSQKTWKRSKAHGGTRYKRVNTAQNREYLIFIFALEKTKAARKKAYLSSKKEGKWSPVTPASDETERAAEEKLNERSTSPRILVIYKNKIGKPPKPPSDRVIINFTLHWIYEHLETDWSFISTELTGGEREIQVARGGISRKKVQVIIGKA